MSHLTRGLFDPRSLSQVWPEPNDDPNIPYAWGLNGYSPRANSRGVGSLAQLDPYSLDLPYILAITTALEKRKAQLTKNPNLEDKARIEEFIASATILKVALDLISTENREASTELLNSFIIRLNDIRNKYNDIVTNTDAPKPVEKKSSFNYSTLLGGACVGVVLSAIVIYARRSK